MSLMPRMRALCAAVCVVALGALAFAGSASAKLTGEFAKFAECPYETAGVIKCLYSPTEGGEVVLGSKTVPIVNPAYLQGGFTAVNKETKWSSFVAAKNGITLSKAPQKVPGGLAGFVKCNEITIGFIRSACEAVFENGLTGVTSTLELAQGASGILINENRLAQEVGTAMRLPLKIRLENPLFGSNCYVGSATTPVVWNLTSGFTPDGKMQGTGGELELLEEGSVLRLKNAVLIDNAWAAPEADGCGGIFSFVIDPIVNASSGLPSASGKNVAILENTINVASALAVKLNNEDNP